MASRLQTGIRVSFWVAGMAVTSSAYGATRSTLDLSAGVGVSSNPSLQLDSQSSVFGRISALGTHWWQSERTTTTLSAYGENTTYSRGYGSKQIFDLRASSVHAVSPTLSIYGNLGFQGDVDGQLSNRFASATPGFNPQQPDQPAPVIDQPLPPVIVDDATFIGLGGRQYRLSGQVGLSMRANERGTVSLSAGAQRNFASGSQSNANFNSYFGTAAYDHQFSARTSAGFSTNIQYQDYDNGLSSTVVNPLVTVSRQFSDQLQGSAAVGLLLSRQDLLGGGSDSSIDPSFSFSLCRLGERDRFCGRVSRDARSSLGVGSGLQANSLAISTLAGVNYSRQLDANQSIQASLSAVRSSTKLSSGDDLRTTYLTFLTGYDRKISQRFAVGANAGARKLFQAGRDPKTDINATAYLRYRFGDIE
ncbi:MAG: hypothetical protein LH610_09580 [Sphingomonas bacterium]|nr:hypothetical protein [Sphingomonas bacterium]